MGRRKRSPPKSSVARKIPANPESPATSASPKVTAFPADPANVALASTDADPVSAKALSPAKADPATIAPSAAVEDPSQALPESAAPSPKEGSLTPQPLDTDTAWPPLSRAASSNGKTASTVVARTPHQTLDSPHRAVSLVKSGNSHTVTVPSYLQVSQQDRNAAAKGDLPKGGHKSWADRVTGRVRSLKHRGERYQLETGEHCVTIPNPVITRNKKAWANFVLGQFHGTLPSMGALHAILNGIWSNKLKDITISRAGNQSVLIKIPNSNTRKRVLDQGIWHIEGQAMFVGTWEPGLKAEIPELKEVPVWVDFRGVPLHFFSAEGLEYIASLVGEPLQLHPRTEAMQNLDVARVFTLVDLQQELPEIVYVRFESGELHKIEVSCPWLPPKCTHCNQFGHSLRRCPTAPIRCSTCKSTTHESIDCNRSKSKLGGQTRASPALMPTPVPVSTPVPIPTPVSVPVPVLAPVPVSAAALAPASAPAPIPVSSTSTSLPSQQVDVQAARNKIANSASGSKQGIRINEPVCSEAPSRKLIRGNGKGKGKSKVLCNAESADSSSEDASYLDSNDDMHTVLKNLPASILKQARRQGKHSKGRALLDNSFY